MTVEVVVAVVALLLIVSNTSNNARSIFLITRMLLLHSPSPPRTGFFCLDFTSRACVLQQVNDNECKMHYCIYFAPFVSHSVVHRMHFMPFMLRLQLPFLPTTHMVLPVGCANGTRKKASGHGTVSILRCARYVTQCIRLCCGKNVYVRH